MTAMSAALLLAAGLPVKPVAWLPSILRPGKPLVLHFWATWCEACREEFPALRSRLLAMPAEGVALELVSIDPPGDAQKAADMLAEYALAVLPAVLLDAPDPGPVARVLKRPGWNGTLPATFVFDARGKLVRSFIGRIDDPAALDRALRKVTSAARARGPAG